VRQRVALRRPVRRAQEDRSEKDAFETLAGIIHAEVKKDTVKVQLTGASGLRQNIKVPVAGGIRTGHVVNTGVPISSTCRTILTARTCRRWAAPAAGMRSSSPPART